MRFTPKKHGFLAVGLVLASGLVGPPAAASPVPASPAGEPPRLPIALDKTETSLVRLLLLDAVVVDRRDRPVAGLDRSAFELRVDGEPIAIDTFDVGCSPSGDDAPDDAGPRRLVLVFDYQHLPPLQREDAIESASRILKQEQAGADQVMLAAMTGGLRIEQDFTGDAEAAARSLRRMRYDVSLLNGNYTHLSESGFVESLETLFAVLAMEPGPKAVILYSAMQHVPLDLEFQRLAAIAASSRTSVYPVDTGGLTTGSSVPATPGLAPG